MTVTDTKGINLLLKRFCSTKYLALSVMLIASFVIISPKSARAADDSSAPLKLAYIDMQKAILETSAGQKANKEFEKDRQAKVDDFKKKEETFKKMIEDYKKKEGALSEDAKNRKRAELAQEEGKLQELRVQSEAQLMKKQQDLMKPIIDKMRDVIERKAKSGKYSMILEKSEQHILWASKDLDITADIVKDFEKSEK